MNLNVTIQSCTLYDYKIQCDLNVVQALYKHEYS